MGRVSARFPNMSEYDTIPDFDWNLFRVNAVYSDEVFGYYKGHYLAIQKQDYDNRSTT